MPVTFRVARHPARARRWSDTASVHVTPVNILETACKQQSTKVGRIVQFSISGEGQEGPLYIIPSPNGFMNTVVDAYNEHHMLILRPDDVWLAVLCQFNFFLNGTGRAEQLRAAFVSHESKIFLELSVADDDMGRMARLMTRETEKAVVTVDPTLRAWAEPDFSTTTDHDRTVGAVLIMSTLKEYFTYKRRKRGTCGLPQVTLEGDKSDWEKILGRIEKLKEYGVECVAWYHLLRPVISRLVRAYDAPESLANVEFWERIVHYRPRTCSPSWYTGWINAFGVFSKEGLWIGHALNLQADSVEAPESLTAKEFWVTYAIPERMSHELVLDDTPYHRLGATSVPPAFAEVDVTVQFTVGGPEVECVMVAGTLGTRVGSSGETDSDVSQTGEDDVMRTMSAWYLFTKRELVDGDVYGMELGAKRPRIA
ncbi:hypothetical protein C8F01DRAFT_1343872 [Mycena amicta]|nr:hypothetical protein C8F01DRAFT_1343872 [Mycena amicta]